MKILLSSNCSLSPDLKYSSAIIYSFLCKPLFHIKLKHPSVSNRHYFFYDYGGQYKNKFNYVNIYHHKKDFGMKCEWNFFATTYGKAHMID